jgi:hypothetical protein
LNGAFIDIETGKGCCGRKKKAWRARTTRKVAYLIETGLMRVTTSVLCGTFIDVDTNQTCPCKAFVAQRKTKKGARSIDTGLMGIGAPAVWTGAFIDIHTSRGICMICIARRITSGGTRKRAGCIETNDMRRTSMRHSLAFVDINTELRS